MFSTFLALLVSAVIYYGIHAFAKPPPRTMTKEWQEATNEYLKVRAKQIPILVLSCMSTLILTAPLLQKEKINPIYGISSEGYKGKGYVMSKPASKEES